MPVDTLRSKDKSGDDARGNARTDRGRRKPAQPARGSGTAAAEGTAPPVDIPMALLLGNPPRMHRDVNRRPPPSTPLTLGNLDLNDAVRRVLSLPGIADKTFLITIGDRSITGREHDQLSCSSRVCSSDSYGCLWQ